MGGGCGCGWEGECLGGGLSLWSRPGSSSTAFTGFLVFAEGYKGISLNLMGFRECDFYHLL